MIKSRWVYTLVICALLPYALLHLAWRALRQRAYLEHIPERFGRYTIGVHRPLIWVHAVSVGETRAAQPLIEALRANYPTHQILISHTTPTGRETGRKLFGSSVAQCYLPYDFPAGVRRFIDHYRPSCGILLETEIWPNLIHACRVRGVPLYLVSARLSNKSLRRYQRFAALVANSLKQLSGISAQSSSDAERLNALGAPAVSVTGNLKFDISPSPEMLALGAQWRRAFGAQRPIVCVASTREGEEALLLDAWQSNSLEMLLVIVPRHPQRFEEVAALLERKRVRFQRRSENQPIALSTSVVLGDSMGEMYAYYSACDVAIIGGSLLPFGAQNPIEACAVGKPIVVGRSTYNFAEAISLALAAGAAIQVSDAPEALAAARDLALDRARAQQMGEAGRNFAREHQGATRKILALLKF